MQLWCNALNEGTGDSDDEGKEILKDEELDDMLDQVKKFGVLNFTNF